MRIVRWLVRTIAPPLALLLLVACVLFITHSRSGTKSTAESVAIILVFAAGAYAEDKLMLTHGLRRRARRRLDLHGAIRHRVARGVGAGNSRRYSRPGALSSLMTTLLYARPADIGDCPMRT